MKEANKGFLQKAFEFIKGVVETIINLVKMLIEVLKHAAQFVGALIKDPIGFLGNLINAVTTGLNQFIANFTTHLQGALIGWLTGEMGSAVSPQPTSLDPPGILSLAVQILGITYANVRSRAVRIAGEPIVARLEQTADVFKRLVANGPIALARDILGKLGDLKSQVIDGIVDFVKKQVIVAGITWILGLLTPASAFIRAAKAIYDIIRFFIELATQIIEFVNSVLNSIGLIVSGAIQNAANAIESSLSKGLTLAISFLASLVGVTGIGAKVRGIVERVRGPINTAIDGVIRPVLAAAKALARKVGTKLSGLRKVGSRLRRRGGIPER